VGYTKCGELSISSRKRKKKEKRRKKQKEGKRVREVTHERKRRVLNHHFLVRKLVCRYARAFVY